MSNFRCRQGLRLNYSLTNDLVRYIQYRINQTTVKPADASRKPSQLPTRGNKLPTKIFPMCRKLKSIVAMYTASEFIPITVKPKAHFLNCSTSTIV